MPQSEDWGGAFGTDEIYFGRDDITAVYHEMSITVRQKMRNVAQDE